MARVYKAVGIRILVCQGCGQEFQAKRNDAKWCLECRRRDAGGRQVHYETSHLSPCVDCGKLCSRKAARCQSCENKKRNGERRGPLSATWKGGRVKRRRDGYWELRIDGERILEHRHIWEQANGPIPDKWVIHHFNGIKDDNRLENLVAMSRSHHGPRAHIDPSLYEARIRDLEARIRELER